VTERKPRLLDLFSGAGGCAKGYQRAGFYVVGVDIKPQPRYCGEEFYQGDALEFLAEHGHEFDAIHASPPCQSYSALRHLHPERSYPDLVDETRRRLEACGVPWVIENVPKSPLRHCIRLCGSAFKIGVRRHRLFESSERIAGVMCVHELQARPIDVSGTGSRRKGERPDRGGGNSNKPHSLAEAREAIGIDWMTRKELSQAIPPAYTTWIGRQLVAHLAASRPEKGNG